VGELDVVVDVEEYDVVVGAGDLKVDEGELLIGTIMSQ